MTIGAGVIPHGAPAITEDTVAFWTGGSVGELRIVHCRACGLYIHPPVPICRRCQSFDVVPEPVSGRGRVYAYTINMHPWVEGYDTPYVIAVVELDEQPGLWITTNIVDCEVGDVHTDMAVEVEFAPVNDAWIPVFHPVGEAE
jgi:uncharacterized OB-fold protein